MKKKLVIFGVYVFVDIEPKRTNEILNKYKESFIRKFKYMEEIMPEYKFEIFIFPVKDEALAKMETIFEGDLTEYKELSEPMSITNE